MRARTGVGVGVALFLVAACGGKKPTARILPGESGVHRAVYSHSDKRVAEDTAIDAATAWCKDRGAMAVFVKEGSEYHGDVDEKTARRTKKAGRIASIFGVHEVENVGDEITGDSQYRATVEFKCK